MLYKVGIIGKFGAKKNLYDGQTVKTKNLTLLLESTKNVKITKVDTCYFRKNNVKLMLDTLRCMFTCEHIFLMVSTNGMHFYLPFLYYLNKFTRRSIYHYIVGSELLDMVRNEKKLVKYLNALNVNWFEYESGTSFLRSKGVKNVSTLTNIKLITPVEKPSVYHDEQGIYRFCTFSRVMEEKGITHAIKAISSINKEMNKTVAVLDIYGPIEPSYAEKFNKLLDSNKDSATYIGVVDSQSGVDVLKNYYALLFPTSWVGEGVPGTVIDSFASGLPIIASDWNANKEVIQHNRNGILYPNDELLTLKDAVEWSIKHPKSMEQMRHECRKEYTKYMPDTVLSVILEEMKKRDK